MLRKVITFFMVFVASLFFTGSTYTSTSSTGKITFETSSIVPIVPELPATLNPVNIQQEIITDQVQCLSKNIYFEAATQSTAGKLAVAFVTKNRVKTGEIYFNTSRGSNPNLKLGIDFFLTLITDFSSSSIHVGSIQVGETPKQTVANIQTDRISKIIGQSVSRNDIKTIFKNLDFDVHSIVEDDSLRLTVPIFRHDISTIQDLAEEVVRSIGINNINSKPLSLAEIHPKQNNILAYNFKKSIRYRAVANGFNESMSFIFYKREILQKYGFDVVKEDIDILNPITSDLNTLRSTIILNLLDSASMNLKNGYKQMAFFEIGSVFNSNRKMSQKMAFIFSGDKDIESFSNSGKPEPITIFEFATKISNIIGDFEIENSADVANDIVHPFKSGRIIQNRQDIGYLAKVLDSVLDSYKLPETFICEIDFDKIDRSHKSMKPISKLQSSTRDITLLVDKDIEYTDIKNSIKQVENENIKEFYLIDVYGNKNIDKKLSLTIRVILQPSNSALSDTQIEEIVTDILDKLRLDLDIYLK
jgi:phenylalanyl-tRNA synthetase beta chain